jgi:predicted dehydrogenase
MSDAPVRLALLGCGGFSANHMQPVIESTGLFRIVTCYDPASAAAEATAARFGARVCGDYADAIRAVGVEAVAVMGPNDVHLEQTLAALAAGRHVFVEKPMANAVADAVAMVRAAEAAGRTLMVGHLTRRYAPFRKVRELIQAGRLGRVVSAEAQFSSYSGMTLPAEAWRADAARCPGLPLNVIGCHLTDVLNMLFGRPRVVAAMHRRAFVPTNDDVTATLVGYDSPVVATVLSHYATPVVHELRVIGTEGVATVLNHGQTLTFRERLAKTEERQDFPTRRALAEEWEEFAGAVRGLGTVETDGRVGVEAVAVTEASVLSAREGRFVHIGELLGNF